MAIQQAVMNEFSQNNHPQQYSVIPSNPSDVNRQNDCHVNIYVDLEPQSDVIRIMTKQNQITLLIQQQSLSALPKREIPNFDGDPLQYPSFIKGFEN